MDGLGSRSRRGQDSDTTTSLPISNETHLMSNGTHLAWSMLGFPCSPCPVPCRRQCVPVCAWTEWTRLDWTGWIPIRRCRHHPGWLQTFSLSSGLFHLFNTTGFRRGAAGIPPPLLSMDTTPPPLEKPTHQEKKKWKWNLGNKPDGTHVRSRPVGQRAVGFDDAVSSSGTSGPGRPDTGNHPVPPLPSPNLGFFFLPAPLARWPGYARNVDYCWVLIWPASQAKARNPEISWQLRRSRDLAPPIICFNPCGVGWMDVPLMIPVSRFLPVFARPESALRGSRVFFYGVGKGTGRSPPVIVCRCWQCLGNWHLWCSIVDWLESVCVVECRLGVDDTYVLPARCCEARRRTRLPASVWTRTDW